LSQLWQFVLVGLTAGGAYALVALGVVAVYRGSGILNFSQGAIGMIGSYVFWDLYDAGNGSLPVVPALVIGVLVGAAVGVIFYVAVVRFLRNASDMAKVVATLGFLLLLESLAVKRYGTQPHLLKPLFGSGKVTIFGGFITNDTLALLSIVAVLAVGLSFMFRRTRLGINATALRENAVSASAIGISPHPTGIVTWGIGGAVAAIAGILLIPVISLSPSALTLLVIPAMAAALVGGFTKIPITVGVALALGVAESILQQHRINSGVIASVPFIVIIIAVVLGGTALPGRGELLSTRLPRVGNGQIKPVKAVVWFGVAVAIPLLLSPTWSSATINSAIFGLLALSIVVVTGYAGQISVASAALAGFGSFIAARCSSDIHLPFLLCLLFGTIAAVALGVVIGAPAVRVRGVNLAIVTLGLSLAVENMILLEPRLTGGVDGLQIHNPSLFGLNLSPAAHPDRFAVLCVIVMAIGSLAVLNVRRGESGRRYLAVRANERGAAAVGVSVSGAKLGAFAVSAALAGLSGALATFQFQIADFSGYDVFQSISALAFTVVGGVGYVAGALFAAVTGQGGIVANFVSNVLHFSTIDAWLPILTGLYVLDVMIRFPDGIILQFVALKNVLLRRIPVRRPRAAVEPVRPPAVTLHRVAGLAAGETALVARDIRVAYGNVVAVDDVSLELTAGRVVGVVGPNGAGKTSLIDALTGFTRMAGGRVELRGQDVTQLRPFVRSRLGMGRTFQNLELFDDLSVRENILTALDSRSRLSYAGDLVHPGRGELSEAALAAIAMLDLERDLDTVVADLPQGRRRMVAIARLVAQQPVAVMLDEPAAGLNGAERRTACELFRALADQLGAAVLLVEHNIDVVATTCDHLIVLDFGRVIAAGPTAAVLQDPVVREAYLGRLTTTPATGHPVRQPATSEVS
jgi:sulfate-transporting ATPase